MLFPATALLGAFLLFLVEPMFARMVLPLLGGAPAVWNTCLVFYQVTLLAGYLYAHLVRARPTRQQLAMHAVLLSMGALVLPIAVRGSATPPASANPIGWVFWLLIVSLGLPFFVLATTGPLLQRWYAAASQKGSGNPYSLFAASNAGSFLGLLGYPLLIEPTTRLRTQSLGWTAGYIGFGLLMLACGAIAWRTAPTSAPVPEASPAAPPAKPARRRRGQTQVAEADDVWGARLRWLGLAAVPSTLMMSVTTFISTDVAAVPLLWVVPLALYLLTFVIAFADRQILPRWFVSALFPVAVVLVVALVLAPAIYPVTTIALHLAAFLVIALACHLELAASRPPAESLTEFYLWLSAGGAVGGLFNALVAPLLFVTPFEYPLAALSACLLLPDAVSHDDEESGPLRAAVGWILAAVPVALVMTLVWAVRRYDAQLPHDVLTRYAIIFAPPCLAAFAMRRAPLRMGIALAAVVVAGSFVRFDNRVPVHVERSFFGVHRVMRTAHETVLLNGTTNHGVQSVNPSLRCEPLSYYSREGPIGQVVSSLKTRVPAPTRFGVVGLGTASMAAYASPGQRWTFYEINPVIERLARDADYFTYLRDCAPDARVVTGDARLMLTREPDGAFDLLVLDAFSSDAIPVHLLTVEAMQLYFRTLAPGGLLAVHISNRFLDLAPVVGAIADRAGLTAIQQVHMPTAAQQAMSEEIAVSRWAVVARSRADLGALAYDAQWQTLDGADGPVWTDDYSNVFGVIRH